QAAMLREYVKWDYELRTPVQLEAVVDRALEMMHAEPRGPVYLTLPREVLATNPGPMTITSPPRRQARSERFPDPVRIDEAARLLAAAQRPPLLASAPGAPPAGPRRPASTPAPSPVWSTSRKRAGSASWRPTRST